MSVYERSGNARPQFSVWLCIGLIVAAVAVVLLFYFRVEEVHFVPETAVLSPGEALESSVRVLPNYALRKNVEYESDNESVAMVDAAGRITAFAPGNAVITATAKDGSGQSGSLWVQVKQETQTQVEILEPAQPIAVGGSLQLGCSVTPDTGQTVTWSVNNPAIATIEQSGLLHATGEGDVQVSVQLKDGASAALTVRVLPQQQEEQRPVVKPVVTPAPRQNGTATVMLVGDLMCLYGQRVLATTENGLDFNGSFAQVKDIFAQADGVVGNLETTVAPAFAYTMQSGEGDIPILNAPVEYLTALKDAGITAVGTANNHCCDTGVQGVLQTLDSLEQAGIPSTGTFAGDEPRYLIQQMNDIYIGIVAYSDFFNQKDALLTKEERAVMINPMEQARMSKDIQAARDAGAQFVIALGHWGTENKQSVDTRQEELAQMLADAGADLIVGAHPHVLQKAEYIEAQDGREVLCFYSLGNFVSSMQRQENMDTVIAQITLDMTAGEVSVADAAYIPCRVFSEFDAGSYVVVPLNDAGSQAAERISGAIGSAVPPLIQSRGGDEWTEGSYMIQED